MRSAAEFRGSIAPMKMNIVHNRHLRYYLAAGIFFLTCAVYLTTLRNDFVDWDDTAYISNNPFIRSLDWTLLKWAFTGFYQANWHPLTWISHALDYAVWGLYPPGHHLTNTLLHGLNAFVVVLVVMKLLETGDDLPVVEGAVLSRDGRRAMIAAGVTGMLFGLHPVHVESVAWISERKDLLCGLFFLLSILAYTDYARTQEAGRMATRPTVQPLLQGRYLLSLMFFIFALLSKPMAVSLPIVLLVLDWHPFQRINSWKTFLTAFAEKLPFALLSLFSSILTIMAQSSGDALALTEFVPLQARLLVAAKAAVVYLGKMTAPHYLLPFYAYPDQNEITLNAPSYLFAVLFLVVITAFFIVLAKKQRCWLSAWGYYCITLLPVIGIVQVGTQSMADRYTYLPSLGPYLLLGLVVAWVWEKAGSLKHHGTAVKRVMAVLLVVLCAVLAFSSVKQISVWENTITLWSHVIEKEHGRSAFAYTNRGSAFLKNNEVDRAIEDFDAAIAVDSFSYEAYNNRGIAFLIKGQVDRALPDFDATIALNPLYVNAYANRGIAYKKRMQFQDAIMDFTDAITLDSTLSAAYAYRGEVFIRTGQYDKAIEDLTAALALDPDALQSYLDRGGLYLKTDRADLAAEDFQKACVRGSEDGCTLMKKLSGTSKSEKGKVNVN